MMPRSRHDHFPRRDEARRQRRHAAAIALDAAWRARDLALRGLLAAMRAQEAATPAAAIAALAPWLADIGWLRARLGEALGLLAADAFARPPLRPVGGGVLGGLLLAEAGAIRLTLLLRPFDAAVHEAAPTALFVPGRSVTRILADGGAMLRFHRVAVSAAEEAGAFTAAGASPCRSTDPRLLRAGETIRLDSARETFGLSGGSGDVLMLQLAIQPPSTLPIRAYDVASGRLVHVSASRRDSSFRQMALALLRAMRRTDAAPLFAAEAASEDFAARWNAMRELIALDPAAARSPLARMAAVDPHPEVRAAAAATLALYPSPPVSGRGSEARELVR